MFPDGLDKFLMGLTFETNDFHMMIWWDLALVSHPGLYLHVLRRRLVSLQQWEDRVLAARKIGYLFAWFAAVLAAMMHINTNTTSSFIFTLSPFFLPPMLVVWKVSRERFTIFACQGRRKLLTEDSFVCRASEFPPASRLESKLTDNQSTLHLEF